MTYGLTQVKDLDSMACVQETIFKIHMNFPDIMFPYQ